MNEAEAIAVICANNTVSGELQGLPKDGYWLVTYADQAPLGGGNWIVLDDGNWTSLQPFETAAAGYARMRKD